MTDLRVATFNIRNGRALDGCDSWPFRRRTTAATMAALGADLLGLQEAFAFQQRYLERRSPDHEAVWVGRDRHGRGEGCPVFARRDAVRILDHRTRWYGERPDLPGTRLPGAQFPRIATSCRVELRESSAAVQFTNTHLDSRSDPKRRRSVEQLVTWLDPSLPQVVVGDLNAGPDDAALHLLAEAGLRSALPPEARGTNHDFTGRLDGRRIDHVLVSEQVEVVDARVVTVAPGARLPSDHWPVVADLRLSTTVPG